MVIELDVHALYAIGAIIAVLVLFIAFRIGISVGRSAERKSWTAVADTAPKSFILTPFGEYTVFSRQEWERYGLIEISDFEAKE